MVAFAAATISDRLIRATALTPYPVSIGTELTGRSR
jgi:hypothetical protein